MRIAMISTPFVAVPPLRYGGTELVVATLCQELTQLGHEIVLFATGDSKVSGQVLSRFSAPVWPPEPYHEIAHAAWAFQRIVADGPFDVVHAHVPSALPFAA